MSSDQAFQFQSTASTHSATCSQHYETQRTPPLFRTLCAYRQPRRQIRPFKITLLAVSAVSHFESDTDQVGVTKINDKLCKINEINISSLIWKSV